MLKSGRRVIEYFQSSYEWVFRRNLIEECARIDRGSKKYLIRIFFHIEIQTGVISMRKLSVLLM